MACGAAFASPAHADDRTKEPTPPPGMSTVGGDRLGLPGTQVQQDAGSPPLPPKLTARSWIVADAESGQVLASHNAHWQLAPASTLKMLFADTVLPKIAKTQEHTVADADLRGMGDGSSLVGVKEKLSYTAHDLWLGVFLHSGNDAVHVLAAMNGGVDKTVQEMNAHAKELQADDTHVVSPDGFDMPGQVSSAYDLTLIARSGLKNPDFREYCATVSAKFPGDYEKDKAGKPTKVRGAFGIQNTDRLLTGADGVRPYPGLIGVKNGFTTNAGNTFTGAAERDGRKLLVTVMHPATGASEVYKETAALLDWGFKAAPTVKPVGTLVPARSAANSNTPADGTKDPAQAAVTAASGSGGIWTTVALSAGALALVAVITFLIHRRHPIPGLPGGSRISRRRRSRGGITD
ncbi:D-alanyl-D-alanine carboxypeptidase [Streptomyces sp. H10-C2]|uniref:D-alanyl-D-alanine carboxypeptidase family protein n=1 Tax=unclassified Streptomyces TaxID=2593676 RepID=UPI0024B88457|nr:MULTISPECIES: D-alanyl-D-alanine carboxypeptidase [unclassified Streptomyces]MDJ0340531.1 D-alanyl-D-alanine carboxypeptidase [Streptomyces sp. PH10-H1]MDJ0370179.1 D-alanyl-D-alanine carboxypeptidase [Streptomyces sp. H10-C2]